MKISSNQSGLAQVAIIIVIVLLLAGIGFASWRVYDVDKKNQKLKQAPVTSQTSSGKTTPVVKVETPKSVVPDGFVEYENKDLGFKFVYKKQWGSVNFTKDTSGTAREGVKSGAAYTLGFSNKKEISGAFKTKDYEIKDGYGRGGAYFDAPLSFEATADSAKDIAWDKDLQSANKILQKTDKSLLEETCNGFTNSATLRSYTKLGLSVDVAYFYYLLRGPKPDGSGADLSGCDNIGKLFEPVQKEFAEFASSIKTL